MSALHDGAQDLRVGHAWLGRTLAVIEQLLVFVVAENETVLRILYKSEARDVKHVKTRKSNGTETRPSQKKGSLGTWSRLPPVVALSLCLRAQSPNREDHHQGESQAILTAQDNKFAVLPKNHNTLNFPGFLREAERRP
jgi:hypothetical protein